MDQAQLNSSPVDTSENSLNGSTANGLSFEKRLFDDGEVSTGRAHGQMEEPTFSKKKLFSGRGG
jgi:hypothetical protein